MGSTAGIGHHMSELEHFSYFTKIKTNVLAYVSFIFYPHHTYYTDCLLGKWQFSKPDHLTPKAWNNAWVFDPETRKARKGNITQDKLCHFNVPVLETWHLGFGNQCVICDQLVQSTAQHKRNESTGVVNQFLNRIPNNLRKELKPIVSKWNAFQTHGLKTPDPSVCNPRPCRPQPRPPTYTSDDNNRRQLKAYRDDWNFNLAPGLLTSDNSNWAAVSLLNTVGYCSSFVTSKITEKSNGIFDEISKDNFNFTSLNSIENSFRGLKQMVNDLEAGLNEIINKHV